MHKVFDNFLPQSEFDFIKHVLESSDFEWYYNDYSVGEDYDQYPQFIHNFIKIINGHGGIVTSQHVDVMAPVFDKLPNLCTIIRCKANLTMATDEPIQSGMHVDTPQGFDGFTAVFYLHDTDGGTIFENGEVVECKANRLLVFDNRMKHSAITCTNKKRRIVVNINYTVWKD